MVAGGLDLPLKPGRRRVREREREKRQQSKQPVEDPVQMKKIWQT